MRKQNWEIAPRLTSHDEQLIGMRRFRNIVEGSQDSPSIYEWIDLGLSSGTLWATCNVGATSPEDVGLYFAWGETQGYEGLTIDKQFNWDDYKFGTANALTKYNNVDGLTMLELEDDAAYQSDNTCRMPTKADFEELIDNTTSVWETLNGVNGRRFTSKTNGNSIFIPAAGSCSNGSVDAVGSGGYYQSSSYNESDPRKGYIQGFNADNVNVNGDFSRYYGLSVRPVKNIN